VTPVRQSRPFLISSAFNNYKRPVRQRSSALTAVASVSSRTVDGLKKFPADKIKGKVLPGTLIYKIQQFASQRGVDAW
jgi:hypothetical protein